ncbi:hypothetical protein [Gallibacterium sp. AGMB14963]|uniref:hypothetical protein n=1 Tax=Gallibacterium faecale TaxID=3019086 RepID=UPI0022F14F91|nr:hypothetical protein [Gallibacterium sp. AGMB14963]MDA3978985.1 hypothetical protein [Gallibacterium sp. AGMB14963]
MKSFKSFLLIVAVIIAVGFVMRIIEAQDKKDGVLSPDNCEFYLKPIISEKAEKTGKAYSDEIITSLTKGICGCAKKSYTPDTKFSESVHECMSFKK